MDFTSDAVRVAATGRIMHAALGTVPPALAAIATPWAAPWMSMGLFDEDAVDHEYSEDKQEIPTWQQGVVRIIVKAASLTLKLKSVEMTVPNLELFYGSPFTKAAASSMTAALKVLEKPTRAPKAFGFEWFDGGSKWRLMIPRAQIAEVESQKFTNAAAVKLGMTITALGSGLPEIAEWITDDPTIVAAAAVAT